jgi:hypothetical protein
LLSDADDHGGTGIESHSGKLPEGPNAGEVAVRERTPRSPSKTLASSTLN